MKNRRPTLGYQRWLVQGDTAAFDIWTTLGTTLFSSPSATFTSSEKLTWCQKCRYRFLLSLMFFHTNVMPPHTIVASVLLYKFFWNTTLKHTNSCCCSKAMVSFITLNVYFFIQCSYQYSSNHSLFKPWDLCHLDWSTDCQGHQWNTSFFKTTSCSFDSYTCKMPMRSPRER